MSHDYDENDKSTSLDALKDTILNEIVARKVLNTVDAGLVRGLGQPVPGQMCVEAAVCYAYGLPHSDDPPCVGRAVRNFKIKLNDARWSNDEARTKGMRALAIAQLGSNEIDQQAFRKIVVEQTIRQIVPMALRAAASLAKEPYKAKLLNAAESCVAEGTRESAVEAMRVSRAAAAYAAAAAAEAAAAAAYAVAAAAAAVAADAYAYAVAVAVAAADADARNKVLNVCAAIGLQALIELKSPGCAYLYLLDSKG